MNGILFNKDQTLLILYPPAKSGSDYNILSSVTSLQGYAFYQSRLIRITLPNGVTNIGSAAFSACTNLINIAIPGSVTSIGDSAFTACTGLKGAYFKGHAPGVSGKGAFGDPTIVYYLPGTTNWSATYGGRPTALWNPTAQTSAPNFGVRTNRFGFNITGTANIPLVVEACTNFGNPIWLPLQSCTLTNGSIYFSDPGWTNCRARFYRLRSP